MARRRRAQLIDVRAAAALLKVSVQWVYQRTHTGVIPHVKDGYWVRFDPVRLKTWARHQPTLRGRASQAAAKKGTLTRYEAAQFLGRSVWWLARQVAAGTIPYLRLGNYVRFPRRALREWASNHGLPP